MRSLWWVAAVTAACGLAACATDDFGEVGSGLPTDVSQDSLLVEGPDLQTVAVEVVVPEPVQDTEDRSRIFLGNRTRDGYRATPVMRFDFEDTLLRDLLIDRLLDEGATADEIALADTIAFTAGLFDSIYVDLNVISRDVARDQDASTAIKKIPRRVAVYETARAITADDVDVATAAEITGALLGEREQTRVEAGFPLRLPTERVIEWIAADGHDGVLVTDLAPGDLDFENPNETNTIAFRAQGAGPLDGSTSEPEVIFVVDQDSIGVANIQFAAPVTIDFTVIEQDAPPAGAAELSSHRTRRTWLQLDLDEGVLPSNATINQAVLTFFPIAQYTFGTPESATASGALDVFCFEATRSEAERADPGRTNASAGISALNFVGQSGFSPLQGDTLRIDVTRFVQRAVNDVVDPASVGLVLLFEGELTDLDRGVFHGPSAADSLRPRVSVTFTPPADSWR